MSISPRVSVPVVKHEQSKHSLDDLKINKLITVLTEKEAGHRATIAKQNKTKNKQKINNNKTNNSNKKQLSKHDNAKLKAVIVPGLPSRQQKMLA